MIAGEHRLALPAGYQLGKYRLKEVLGAGGFGITYLAEDGSLGRSVAIKELLPNDIATRLDGSTVVAKTKSEEDNLAWARDRFIKEGRALAACDHPNVVNVYEMIEANGTAYMVTKFEEGRSLSEWLKEVDGAPTEKELRSILVPLLSGLEKVHKAGFLHRDLKPENIYLTDDGRPILLDFGSARQAVSDRTTSLTSIVTAGYAPFEQYHEDGKQGAWTDIYALAAVMYRAIHGKKPPEATRRLKDDPCLKLAKQYAGKYSPQFLTAIDKALAVEHAKRPQSVAEWKQLLGAAPAEEKIIAEPWWMEWLAKAEPWIEWARARPLAAGGIAAGVLLLSLIAWKALQPPHVPRPNIVVATPEPEPPKPVPPISSTPEPSPPAPQPPPVASIVTSEPKPLPLSEPAAPLVEPVPKKTTIWEAFKNPDPPSKPVEPPEKRLGPRPGEKWTNSLGQVFAWVPGLPMHMATWETRRGDFEAFVRATGYNATAGVLSWTSKGGWKAQGASWVNPGFTQTPTHPVVGVSVYDALEFCRWLTEKDRAAGLIDERLAYRLPTEVEWGKALPDWKFPWGEAWPPTVGAGNYAGEEGKTSLGSSRIISGYRDGFTGTSPVGTFQANAAGFHDLGGNAIELCATWFRKEMNSVEVSRRNPNLEKFEASAEPAVVLRGGSWITANADFLLLAARDFQFAQERYVTVGFRCVLAPVEPAIDFTLPLLPRNTADDAPAPAEGDAVVEKRLVGIWEAKAPASNGTVTFRWEQEPDGAYTVSIGDTTTDTGHLTASGGHIRQQSTMNGSKTTVTYRFKTTSQMVTTGPLGDATWRRISSTTTKQKEALAAADGDDESTKEKSGGTQASTKARSNDPPSRPKSSGTSVERKARDLGNSIRRRFGF